MALFSGKFGKAFGCPDVPTDAINTGTDEAAAPDAGKDSGTPSGEIQGHEVEADAAHRRDSSADPQNEFWMEPLQPSIFDTASLKALYMTRPISHVALSPTDDLKSLIKRAIDERALPLTMFMLAMKLYGVTSGDKDFYRSTMQDYVKRWGSIDDFLAMESYGAFYVRFFRDCTIKELTAAMEHIKEMRAAASAPPDNFRMPVPDESGTSANDGKAAQ